MPLTPIQVIASILAIIALIKIIVVLINKKSWYNYVVKPIYSHGISAIIFVILAVIIFYYLLRELTLAQIFAVLALSSLLFGIGFMQYSKELLPLFKKLYDKKINFWRWIYIIFWLILLILTLFEIF